MGTRCFVTLRCNLFIFFESAYLIRIRKTNISEAESLLTVGVLSVFYGYFVNFIHVDIIISYKKIFKMYLILTYGLIVP